MTANPTLIKGNITADDYEDAAAADPRIDALREKMTVVENKQYSIDYLDPEKRSIANAVQVFFEDGTSTENVEVEYPLYHRFRREEAIPKIITKFSDNIAAHYSAKQQERIKEACLTGEALEKMVVHEFVNLFTL